MLSVSVLKSDISRAKMLVNKDEDCRDTCCPLALALKRKYKKPVSVDYDEIVLGNRCYETSADALKVISEFDDGKTVRPRKVTLQYLPGNTPIQY